MRYSGHASGGTSALHVPHTLAPLEFVTENDGDVPPTITRHARSEVLRIDAVIFTMVPGP